MDKLLRFVELTQNFKEVPRKIIISKHGRAENDAEHSYQLALVAWYIIDSKKLNLDANLCIRYALVHDLVEVYAGDTPAIGKKYEGHRLKKHEREQRAIQKLMFEHPEFEAMHDLIRRYELKEDEESKFVYALDKVLPELNIYLDKGYLWKLHNNTIKEIIDEKEEKIRQSPEVKKYFDLLVEILKSEQKELFNEVSE